MLAVTFWIGAAITTIVVIAEIKHDRHPRI